MRGRPPGRLLPLIPFVLNTMKMIDSYSFGRMVVDGCEYGKDLMILPGGGILCPWWRKTGHSLALTDIVRLLAAKPGLLIIGTGAYGFMKPAPGFIANLDAQGVRSEVLPTAQAVIQYNSLLGQEYGLAACFHLTC